ncbi:NADH dehydrogenase [ubiquinone] 1 alpha subcomplex assembly factor 4 [Tachypleus tridentatus]|uniref:NADH dehydrogenase [ubiquinone] 1 alpha subcomplex assembly factor 4 n=1 Tax=Tachypleus tridentatus TaxID=6853 RepID=UPI003FD32F07
MGKLYSVFIRRPLQNFNVENRASKVLSDKKIRKVPRHPSSIPYVSTLSSDPKAKEYSAIQNDLLEHLKSIKVVSKDPEGKVQENVQEVEEIRPLPQDRKPQDQPEYGFIEPATIPPGKIKIRQALEFITNHHSDPQQWTVDIIAKEHNMNKVDVEHIVKYFKTFYLYIPQKAVEKGQKQNFLTFGINRLIPGHETRTSNNKTVS